jgi:uncharacterized membrane protein YgdD (TMEM256/DUF423 family)
LTERRPHVALLAGALFGLAGVLLGAFGAHALESRLDARELAIWETAVQYQFWHALALLAVGLLARGTPGRALGVATALLIAGTLAFSGSLYALLLFGTRGIALVTPAGGLALAAGWVALIVHLLQRRA